jgi:hypothetical protein
LSVIFGCDKGISLPIPWPLSRMRGRLVPKGGLFCTGSIANVVFGITAASPTLLCIIRRIQRIRRTKPATVSVSCKREPMHNAPAQIARSLRAFRNAHRLKLLRSVRISPGNNACKAALSQTHVEYLGNVVPRLPLIDCTRARCECTYVPVGGGKLMDRLRAIVRISPGRPAK